MKRFQFSVLQRFLFSWAGSFVLALLLHFLLPISSLLLFPHSNSVTDCLLVSHFEAHLKWHFVVLCMLGLQACPWRWEHGFSISFDTITMIEKSVMCLPFSWCFFVCLNSFSALIFCNFFQRPLSICHFICFERLLMSVHVLRSAAEAKECCRHPALSLDDLFPWNRVSHWIWSHKG